MNTVWWLWNSSQTWNTGSRIWLSISQSWRGEQFNDINLRSQHALLHSNICRPQEAAAGRVFPQLPLADLLSADWLSAALGPWGWRTTNKEWGKGAWQEAVDGHFQMSILSLLIQYSEPNTADPILLRALSSVKSDWQSLGKREWGEGSGENGQECIIHSALSDNEMFQMSESSR